MFLVWDSEEDADASLAAVNAVYGCAYSEPSGYEMNTWDRVTKSDAEDKWGFVKPEARLGKAEAELEAALVMGYAELDNIPENWKPKEIF